MKRILVVLLSALMLMSLVGCNSNKEDTPIEETEKQEEVVEPTQEEPEIVGGYIDVEDGTITTELQELFDTALKGLLGANYEAKKLIASQLVAGTNYKFLAEATKITNPITIGTYYVYINKDLDGNISLLDIETINEETLPKQEEQISNDPTKYSYWVITYDQYGNVIDRYAVKYGTTVKDSQGNEVVVKGNTRFYVNVKEIKVIDLTNISKEEFNNYFENKDGTTKTNQDGTLSIGNGESLVLKDNVTDLIVPEKIDGQKVTEISENCFKNNNNLETVTIPGGIKKIDDYAFRGCESLKTVKINDGVEEIGNGIFGLTNDITVYLPKSLTRIGTMLFDEGQNVTVIYEGTKEEFEKLLKDSFTGGSTYVGKQELGGRWNCGLNEITCANGVYGEINISFVLLTPFSTDEYTWERLYYDRGYSSHEVPKFESASYFVHKDFKGDKITCRLDGDEQNPKILNINGKELSFMKYNYHGFYQFISVAIDGEPMTISTNYDLKENNDYTFEITYNQDVSALDVGGDGFFAILPGDTVLEGDEYYSGVQTVEKVGESATKRKVKVDNPGVGSHYQVGDIVEIDFASKDFYFFK